MLSKFQKNTILSGYLNSYCLVCEKCFDTEDATIAHINEDLHLKELLSHPYLEKYGDNHIRKVSKGYFCEFCGLLLATAAKVSLHVKEKSHFDSKGNFLLRRSNGLVVAFENVVISERAWHGVADDACALCDVEFDNEDIHISEPAHLLNVVQYKVEFGPNNSLYRKTEDSSFQCLTCNSVFALNNIEEHFNDSEHQKLYAKCQQDIKKHDAPIAEPKTDSENESAEMSKENPVKEKNDNAGNKEIEANNCKEVLKIDKKLASDDSINFAKENNITYNAGQTNAYCRLCEIKLPSSLRCMREHVQGKEHTSRSKAVETVKTVVKPKVLLTRRPLNKFIHLIVVLENLFHQDVVINEKYCISQISFTMFTRIGSRFRCQYCEVNLYADDFDEHIKTARHQKGLQEVPIITSMADSEFIREVRPDIFHCGFCNQVSSGVEALQAHLRCSEHCEAREAAAWLLQRHLPAIRQHRQQRQREQDIFEVFMHRRLHH